MPKLLNDAQEPNGRRGFLSGKIPPKPKKNPSEWDLSAVVGAVHAMNKNNPHGLVLFMPTPAVFHKYFNSHVCLN